MKLEPTLDSLSLVPLVSSTAVKLSCSQETLRLYHDPSAWRRWLDWVPKVCLPPREMIGSPFTSPANTSLQQRIFLNGTALEFPLK